MNYHHQGVWKPNSNQAVKFPLVFSYSWRYFLTKNNDYSFFFIHRKKGMHALSGIFSLKHDCRIKEFYLLTKMHKINFLKFYSETDSLFMH